MILSPHLLDKLPCLTEWIRSTLEHYKTESKPVLDFKFANLGLYFSLETLNLAKVVAVNKVPVPPLSNIFGIKQLSDFEKRNYAGITYIDTYFLVSEQIHNETLHFHELVHIIQWNYLGVDGFLKVYGISILRDGYLNNVFEKMAYRHQRLFEQKADPYDIEKTVQKEIDTITPDILKELS